VDEQRSHVDEFGGNIYVERLDTFRVGEVFAL